MLSKEVVKVLINRVKNVIIYKNGMIQRDSLLLNDGDIILNFDVRSVGLAESVDVATGDIFGIFPIKHTIAESEREKKEINELIGDL